MPVEIPLTRGYVALVDEVDADFLLEMGRWHVSVKPNARTAYARHSRTIGGRRENGGRSVTYAMHRVILERVLGYPPQFADHRDGNGLNKTRDNLRNATPRQNNANRRTQLNNKSGHPGLFYRKEWNAYDVSIRFEGKSQHLGRFRDRDEAIAVYRAAHVRLFGEFSPYAGDV
jgi:hypothetical protein